MINFLYSALFSFSILYAWATLCYLYVRFSRPETESRMRDFLKTHRKFFSDRTYQESGKGLTKEMIQKKSLWGWAFVPLVCFSMRNNNWNYPIVLTNVGLLFFAGLFFALGWYGIRCLRLLGLDSYQLGKDDKHGPNKGINSNLPKSP
jgi:hypothetical protein